jgi:hypothetical protein
MESGVIKATIIANISIRKMASMIIYMAAGSSNNHDWSLTTAMAATVKNTPAAR